jgi:sulfite exporter TauE/SafE
VLPCGLTSIALAYCISLSTPQEGFLFMLIFGLATLPVMLGLTSIFQIYIKKLNFSFQRVTTVTMILLGILLISRSIISNHHTTIPDTAINSITICQ